MFRTIDLIIVLLFVKIDPIDDWKSFLWLQIVLQFTFEKSLFRSNLNQCTIRGCKSYQCAVEPNGI